jgi:two-component system, OmpR family, sensor histidine kinase MprB
VSLRWRIALSLASVAGAVGLIAAVGAYLTTSHQIRTSVDKSLRDRAVQLNSQGGRNPGRVSPPGHDDCINLGKAQPANPGQFILADGSKNSCAADGKQLPVLPSDLSTGAVLRTVGNGHDAYRLLTEPWHEGGYVQLARPLAEGHDILERLAVQLALLTFAGITLAAGLGWLLATRAVRPIIRLRTTAEAIASTQDLSIPIPVDGTGEVGSLAHSFNTMIGALSGSREQQKRLISDASHEMRTPLTSLRTNIDLLGHFDQLSELDRREVLAAVQVDAGELTHLLSELVELATDQTTNTEQPEPVRLVDLAVDVVARAARRSGRVITVSSVDPDLVVSARPAMMERAISNLVENAVKYSPTGTTIEVNVDGSQVEVRDHGPGIDEADQPFVFDRFYRATQTRTEPGSGLGLAIVKQIIDRHAGSVWAKNNHDGGARVGFALPH